MYDSVVDASWKRKCTIAKLQKGHETTDESTKRLVGYLDGNICPGRCRSALVKWELLALIMMMFPIRRGQNDDNLINYMVEMWLESTQYLWISLRTQIDKPRFLLKNWYFPHIEKITTSWNWFRQIYKLQINFDVSWKVFFIIQNPL